MKRSSKEKTTLDYAYDNKVLSDLSLNILKKGCQDKVTIAVSKLHLASKSGFFHQMFLHWFKQAPQSQIRPETDFVLDEDVEITHFIDLIRAMYKQPLNTPPKDLLAVLKLADKYQVDTAIKCCVEILSKQEMTLDKACTFLKLSEQIKKHEIVDQFLIKPSSEFVLHKFQRVRDLFRSEEFLGLSVEAVLVLVKSDDLIVDSENSVLYFIMTWIFKDPDSREIYFSQFLQYIRFPQMLKYFLLDIVPHVASQIKDPIAYALIHYYRSQALECCVGGSRRLTRKMNDSGKKINPTDLEKQVVFPVDTPNPLDLSNGQQKPQNTPNPLDVSNGQQKPHNIPNPLDSSNGQQKPHNTPNPLDVSNGQKPHNIPNPLDVFNGQQKPHNTPNPLDVSNGQQKPHNIPNPLDSFNGQQKPHDTPNPLDSFNGQQKLHNTPNPLDVSNGQQKPHNTPNSSNGQQKPHDTPNPLDSSNGQLKPLNPPNPLDSSNGQQKPRDTPNPLDLSAGQQKPQAPPTLDLSTGLPIQQFVPRATLQDPFRFTIKCIFKEVSRWDLYGRYYSDPVFAHGYEFYFFLRKQRITPIKNPEPNLENQKPNPTDFTLAGFLRCTSRLMPLKHFLPICSTVSILLRGNLERKFTPSRIVFEASEKAIGGKLTIPDENWSNIVSGESALVVDNTLTVMVTVEFLTSDEGCQLIDETTSE